MALSLPNRRSQRVLIAGAVLAFLSALGVYGTFVQWHGATVATAAITGEQQEVMRRASSNVALDIRYEDENGAMQTETVSVAPNRSLEAGGEVEVAVMRGWPWHVTPVDVLESKRRGILYLLGLAGLVVLSGLAMRITEIRRKPRAWMAAWSEFA